MITIYWCLTEIYVMSLILWLYCNRLHDLDNDQQLDGLELLAAMNHIAVRQSDISNEDLAKYPEGRQQLQNWWNEKFEEDARKN